MYADVKKQRHLRCEGTDAQLWGWGRGGRREFGSTAEKSNTTHAVNIGNGHCAKEMVTVFYPKPNSTL